jgi:protein-disulfide isomerase
VAELVATCARARLVGRAVAGPDGTRTAWFGWTAEPPRVLDAEAYVALGVARGLGRGPGGAPVTVVAFVDIAGGWGFGGKAIASWGEVLERWPDEVRVVVKLCPMAEDHAMAAEAVHAAAAQGALWPMLARIGADPARVAREDLVGHAAALGLDAGRLAAELAARAFRDAAERDVDQMVAMDIDALPCALVDGRRVHGALPAASCLAAVEQALARGRKGIAGDARASAAAGSGDR